jgi:HK97 gp10 family phage protein
MAVEGIQQLLKKFDQLSVAGKAKVLRAACRGAGAAVAKDARTRIPVGSESHRTYDKQLVAPGFARRSIVVQVQKNFTTGAISAVVGVRARAFYAMQFIEMERGKSSQTGRPWLVPAFEATRAKQISEFERRFKDVIAKALKKQ